MTTKRTYSGPVFGIRLSEGLADRHRVPLDSFIRVLNESRSMIEEAGRRIQMDSGQQVNVDFGLEIIGGIRKGSVTASIAITRNRSAGIAAANAVLDTVKALRGSTLPATQRKTPDVNPRVVAKLNNIAKVQEIMKTKLNLTLTHGKKVTRAVFDHRAVEAAAEFRVSNLTIDDLTIYGKLKELEDKSPQEVEHPKRFYGELLSENGEVWRVQFKEEDLGEVRTLFAKQIRVCGQADYYASRSPRLIAKEFGLEEDRDYLQAFDDLCGAMPELEDKSLETLIEDARGCDK